MTRRNVLLWLGIATAAIIVNLAVLNAPDAGVPRLVFIPIALCGLVGAYAIGVRKTKKASVRSRVLSGAVWSAPWLLLLCLPWGALSGAYAWERVSPVRPPGVAGPLGAGVFPIKNGVSFGYTVDASWPQIEQHFAEQLGRRGWRHVWTREYIKLPPSAPPGAPLPRWILFRRADGMFLVQIGMQANGRTAVVTDYKQLEWAMGDTSHILRDVRR